MIKSSCPKFETCSSALCPLDPHPRRYWYADTEICRSKNSPGWIKTQRKIQKVNPDPHSYYTQKMLESITRVAKNINGINGIGYNPTEEYEWIHARENRHRTITIEHGPTQSTGDNPGKNAIFLNATRSKITL